MNSQPNNQRRADLAKIHLAKKDLAMTDEDYRAMLWAQGRVHSAADLDHTGRQRVLAHLRACGWPRKQEPMRLTPQQWRIKRIWRDLGDANALEDRSDKALLAFIKSHGGPDALQFVDTRNAAHIIDALQGWLKRVSKK